MKIQYQQEIDKSYLLLETPKEYHEDYQAEMLRHNEIQGLLRFSSVGEEGKDWYYYEIDGAVSLRALFQKTDMTQEDIRLLVMQLLKTLEKLGEYLLNPGKLFLSPDCIFYGGGTYKFCYVPFYEGNFRKGFHQLTEFLVERVSYGERTALELAGRLHRLTMEEHYSAGQIAGIFSCPVSKEREKKGEIQRNGADSRQSDLCAEVREEKNAGGYARVQEEKQDEYRREKLDLWNETAGYQFEKAFSDSGNGKGNERVKTRLKRMSVAQFLGKKKQEKWGDWDRLLLGIQDL